MEELKYNYKRDNKGWVTFTHGRKKQKLRAYVAFLARSLQRQGDERYNDYRDFLIEHYNKDGLQGIKLAYTLKTMELIGDG